MRPALFVNIHSFIEISFSRLKPTCFFYEVSLFFKCWTDICCDCLLMSYVDTIVFHLFPDLYKNKKMVWSHRLTAKVSLKVFLIIGKSLNVDRRADNLYFQCGIKGHYANRCPKGDLAFLSSGNQTWNLTDCDTIIEHNTR